MNMKVKCQERVPDYQYLTLCIGDEAGGQCGICVGGMYRICFIEDSEIGRQRLSGVSTRTIHSSKWIEHKRDFLYLSSVYFAS
jgi:hypothetical protein